MKYTLLGIGPGLPNPTDSLSALVVQTDRGSYLADCGEGTAAKLVKHGFSKDFLDAIVITHYHPDHVGGLFMVIQLLYLEGRTKSLNLFLPEREQEFMSIFPLMYTFEQKFSFRLNVYGMEELNDIHTNVVCYANDHLSGYKEIIERNQYGNEMKAYSLIFQEADKQLAYTSDLRTLEVLKQNFQQTDAIIMDALHPSADEIINYANAYTNKLILTHGISAKLKDWLQHNEGIKAELAVEDKTCEL